MNILSFSYCMSISLQFLLLCFAKLDVYSARKACFASYQNATLGKEANGTVSAKDEDIYLFDYTHDRNNDEVCLRLLCVLKL